MTETRETPIWRDGNRLASAECGGFIDTVPDENLAGYAADAALHPLDRAFAAAVLAIREFERQAAQQRLERLAGVRRA